MKGYKNFSELWKKDGNKSFLQGVYTVIFLVFCILSAGCETTSQVESALEKARAFALEETRDLTEYQRNVIRYSLPVVQGQMIHKTDPIKLTEYEHIPRNEFHKPLDTKHLDFVASSFVWRVPDLGGEVVVYGTGDRAFRFWRPLKVLYRKIAEPDKDYLSAWKKAVSFTEDNMLYITDTERDRIRFSEAKVWCTAFDLKYLDEDKPRKKQTTSWTSYLLKKQGGKQEQYQVSLVWQADDPAKFIVFTGLGAKIPRVKKEKVNADSKEKIETEKEKKGEKDEFSLLKNWNILTVRVIDKVKFSKYVEEFKFPVENVVKSEEKADRPAPERKEKESEEKK